MKVFISVDMEGISGVVAWEHTESDKPEYARFRRLMTGEANAAIAGAIAGGATEIVVNDSHGGMKNILIEEINPAVRLITGSGKKGSMMEGVDESFDLVLLVGYHARAMTRGTLAHTFTGSVRKLVINGREVGETGMNAMIAGAHGVPVGLVTGDAILEQEAKEFFGGNIEFATVKVPIGSFSANCLPPEKAQEAIREAARRAVQRARDFKPVVPAKPAVWEVTWQISAKADACMMIPGMERVDDTTVRFTADDYLVAFQAFRAMTSL
ncbi:MAG: M55 family metallopeptidase [Chloroflexota bacterium]